ncbi:type I-MYXAN CRISPR-associated protein Cas6/Cmx6 [Leptolyngbya sp. AN02str]|uniref:type I-MYXAN CRISPR-associated protein Cas6/Cmx6 n=1 Tax=Leptolyngbya sp. AN02str TaxID=3423363 RepID=UPI003D31D7A4
MLHFTEELRHENLDQSGYPTNLIDAFTELPLLVELSFDVVGQAIPVDHAYELFSAIAHFQAQLHDLKLLSIQTITNTTFEDNKLLLSKFSKLRMRVPAEQVRLVYSLANKSLMLSKDKIRLGIPKIDLLQPASTLYSRMVVIKGHQQPELFLAAAQSQLMRLGVDGKVAISVGSHGSLNRKTLKIRGFTVVGFGLEVVELNEQDSLKLQIYGIGGKRKMGCGIFVPKQRI